MQAAFRKVGLGHLTIADVSFKKKVATTGADAGKSQMDVYLDAAATEAFVTLAKAEELGRFRTSLDGEEMRLLWANRKDIVGSLMFQTRGEDDGEASALVNQITTMMDLWDKAQEILLALEWDHDRSDELVAAMRAWRDHVHASFGPELRMPSGAEFVDCIPVHYATEEGHLGFHAKSLYIRHNLAIGCLTDQAGEQYNQLVKHDITPGQGSSTNGQMSAKVVQVEGKPAYSSNKFWLEVHRLLRVFFVLSSDFFQSQSREFKKCGRCGGPGHAKNQYDRCPEHRLYQAPQVV